MWSTLALLVLTSATATASGWTYSGQSYWSKIDKQCSGRSQSPIDIETEKVKYDKSLAVSFKGFDRQIPGSTLTLSNNGHTVKLMLNDPSISGDQIPLIKGAALGDKSYKFVQLHFHWHMDQTSGTEHAINGRRYALEMHYVHVNTKYSDMVQAAENKDGLAVFAVLFQVTRKNNSYLDPLIPGLQRVREEGNTTLFGDSIILDQLLPNDLDHFFKYSGSLTTPPCSESVTWIIFREISGISLEQLNSFRSLMRHDEEHHEVIAIGHNVRDLQKVRKREIFASGSAAAGSPAGRLSSSLLPCILVICFTIVISCCRH